jgi:hypothetical protein
MKAKQIRFFSPTENSETKKEKKVTKVVPATGYISGTGKVILPNKTIDQLGFDPQATRFKIGTQEGKRKIKSLYLVPAGDDQEGSFELEQAAKNYGIPLSYILQKGGINFADNKHDFTVKPFEYEPGVTGYELKLSDKAEKPEYTGKPRGRKPKIKPAEE